MASLYIVVPVAARSVLVLLETVLEEEESGALVLLLLLVGEAESTLVVHLLSNEELHLVESASDKLDELGGTLLEPWDAIGLASLVELGDDLLHVASAPLHELDLGEALHFEELELVLDVDHGLTLTLFFLLLIGGDVDDLSTLSDVLCLGLNASIVHGDLMGERVREEFVS